MAQAGLTVRGTSQAGGKPEHSDPTIRIRRGGSSTDKSYSRDNRLVPPKSSYRRRSSAPRSTPNVEEREYEQFSHVYEKSCTLNQLITEKPML